MTAGPAAPRGRYLATLSLVALGVVYGDIGTSPLYAMREAFHGPHAIAVTPGNILGVLSLIFWSLALVVTIKYHIVIIRADNKGEGGVLALMALVHGTRLARGLSPRRVIIMLGIFGAALMYADGALTPAISVMSAVEGLAIATPALAKLVVPVTIVILTGLFWFQSRGTVSVGSVFGPVMLLWFLTIAVLGVSWILREPAVLGAVSPHHAARFFLEDPGRGSWSSAPCFSWSPAVKRCTPISGTSAIAPSRSRGFRFPCPPCSSITSARARSCCASRRQR